MRIIDVLENAAENVESDSTIDRTIGAAQIKAAVRLLKQGHPPEANIYEIVDKDDKKKDERK